ncbi:hypothetical protein Bca101_087055 [Brassica carinata]
MRLEIHEELRELNLVRDSGENYRRPLSPVAPPSRETMKTSRSIWKPKLVFPQLRFVSTRQVVRKDPEKFSKGVRHDRSAA